MFTVRVFNNTGTSCLATFADATVKSWSRRINAPGPFAFTLPVSSANVAYLQKYRQITLERRKQDGTFTDEGAWIGYIEAHKRTSAAEYTVFCQGMLQLFRKRLTAKDEVFNTQVGLEALGLLSDTNADSDTGISAGVNTVTAAVNLKAAGRKDILGMWDDLRANGGGEYEIDFTRKFNIVSSLGSDKSGTVTLTFHRDGDPGNTVTNLEDGEDGAPMANRIIGTSPAGAGLEYVWNDPVNQTPSGLAYPLLIEAKEFREAQDLTALTAMTTAYGQQRANPITDYQVSPILAQRRMNTVTGVLETVGLQYGDVVPGDLVMCNFQTESQSILAARRVAEIVVEVDENLKETVRYTLTKSGIFVTSNYLDFDRVGDLTRRIQAVERLL